MGSFCGKAEDDDEYYSESCADRRLTTVGMLAQALQANGLAQAVAHMDAYDAEERIRLAKAQMRTVTVRNGCLYIDYELVGRLPPGVEASVY